MIPPSFCVAMVFTPCIHTSEALKASKSQQRKLLPYTSQREKKKKPHLSQTQQINHHSPSHPQHTVSSNLPKASINQNPNPRKRGAATAQSPRSNQAPQTALSSHSLATLYLPCKPTKTKKTPSKGPGKIAARMHMYVWYVQ